MQIILNSMEEVLQLARTTMDREVSVLRHENEQLRHELQEKNRYIQDLTAKIHQHIQLLEQRLTVTLVQPSTTTNVTNNCYAPMDTRIAVSDNIRHHENMSDINITNNFYAPIGQNLNYVKNHKVSMTHDRSINIQRAENVVKPTLAADSILATERAEALFAQARAAGWLDADGQPQELSRARVAMLADRIGQLLQLPQNRRWQPFEVLWGRRNMRADLQKALKSGFYADFCKILAKRIV